MSRFVFCKRFVFRLKGVIPCLLLAVLGTVLPSICLATVPLTLTQFTDCIGANHGNWDSDCVLQSNQAGYAITQSLTVSRSCITIEGAYPYPALVRAAGSSQSLMVVPASTNPCSGRMRHFRGATRLHKPKSDIKGPNCLCKRRRISCSNLASMERGGSLPSLRE